MSSERAKRDVAWVSCVEIPEPDTDEVAVIGALREAGLSVEKVAWDDPDAPSMGEFKVSLLRSPWNYFERPADFQAWIARTATDSLLLNPAPILRWNLHKGYLRTLERVGVPTVPTEFLASGNAADVRSILARRGWDDVVLKPTISAGSFATARFRMPEADRAQAFLDRHLQQRDMMVQCYVPAVETSGETCMVWIDGEFTHAVVKQPRFAEDDEQVSEAIPVEGELRALGVRALEVACADAGLPPADLLYARVDVVEHGGQWVVGELELLEPSLFLCQSPPALERFVEAVAARVERRPAARG